jgi:alpha-D-ribose 1-methylphosphonate 5-phosphate C-P lyase
MPAPMTATPRLSAIDFSFEIQPWREATAFCSATIFALDLSVSMYVCPVNHLTDILKADTKGTSDDVEQPQDTTPDDL